MSVYFIRVFASVTVICEISELVLQENENRRAIARYC